MKDYARLARLAVCVTTAAITSTFTAGTARAQAAPPPADVPPPPPAAPVAAPPPPVVVAPVPDGTPPSTVATEAKPPTASEAMPATRPEVLPPIDVGAWVRASGIFQGSDPSKLNDWHMDNAYVELHAGGKITKNVGVTLNLNAQMANYGVMGATAQPVGSNPLVSLEDAIISFDFVDEFHLWGGHLLVPVDRANSSGPFFMIPWNFPGVAVDFAIPKEGPTGRNNGAVIWGDLAGGRATYLVGAFDNGDVTTSPLFSGRLRVALLDPEKGFWGNCGYFGDKDILSFDLGGQAQAHGDGATATQNSKTYAEVNVGGLFEKKVPGGGWFTAEGAYYHYSVNDGNPSNSLYVLAAFATPPVGVGNIQPMVRYQWAGIQGGGPSPWNIDAALSYLIKGPALRAVVTYSHSKMISETSANSIQLGAQAIFF
jgi:hypothetical protein